MEQLFWDFLTNTLSALILWLVYIPFISYGSELE